MGELEGTLEEDELVVAETTGVCVSRDVDENASLLDGGWLIDGDTLADSDARVLGDPVVQNEPVSVNERVVAADKVRHVEKDAEKVGEYVVDGSEETVAVAAGLGDSDIGPDAVAPDFVALTDTETEPLPSADALSRVIVTCGLRVRTALPDTDKLRSTVSVSIAVAEPLIVDVCACEAEGSGDSLARPLADEESE